MTKFVCQRCGKCCGIVPFTKKEYNAVRKIAQQRHIGFTKYEMAGKTVYFPKSAYREFLNAVESIFYNFSPPKIQDIFYWTNFYMCGNCR